MIEILKKINESGLTPNQYFLLFALPSNLEVKGIDVEAEKQILIDKGFLIDGGASHELVSKEFDHQALINRVRQFQQIFPPIILPTGLPARGKHSQILLKLKTFITNYPYDWDTIYAAAEKYVNRYRMNKFLYMQNASNFVLDKNGDSTLALECDTLEYNDDTSGSI